MVTEITSQLSGNIHLFCGGSKTYVTGRRSGHRSGHRSGQGNRKHNFSATEITRYINKINKINYGSTGSHKSCHHEYNLLGTWLKATKMADSSEAENKVGSNLNVKFIVCVLLERRHILKVKVNNFSLTLLFLSDMSLLLSNPYCPPMLVFHH